MKRSARWLLALSVGTLFGCAPTTSTVATTTDLASTAQGSVDPTPDPGGGSTNVPPVTPPSVQSKGTSQIKVTNGGQALCLEDSGSGLLLKTCSTSTLAQFFKSVSHTDGSLSLQSASSSGCLQLNADDLAVDSSLVLATCAAGPKQNFAPSFSSASNYQFVSQDNGGCLSVSASGQPVLAKCDLSAKQVFAVDATQLSFATYSAALEKAVVPVSGPALSAKFKGMNLTGAESGNLTTANRPGYNYAYPKNAAIDYLARKGFTIMRVPFKAERLQPKRNGALDPVEFARLDSVVQYARSKGIWVLLDPHGYGNMVDSSGNSALIGSATLPASQFANFWAHMAAAYVNQPNVIYGLMNEPHALNAKNWQSSAVSAVSAIRSVGAQQQIFIPGVSWTGAHSWISSGNGAAWAYYSDKNFVFEIHQYFDSDSSGTHAACVAGSGSSTFNAWAPWAAKYQQRGFLAEVGWDSNAACQVEGEAMLKAFNLRPDIYVGWSYFGMGWYNGFMTTNPANLGAANEVEKAQAVLLEKYLN